MNMLTCSCLCIFRWGLSQCCWCFVQKMWETSAEAELGLVNRPNQSFHHNYKTSGGYRGTWSDIVYANIWHWVALKCQIKVIGYSLGCIYHIQCVIRQWSCQAKGPLVFFYFLSPLYHSIAELFKCRLTCLSFSAWSSTLKGGGGGGISETLK